MSSLATICFWKILCKNVSTNLLKYKKAYIFPSYNLFLILLQTHVTLKLRTQLTINVNCTKTGPYNFYDTS